MSVIHFVIILPFLFALIVPIANKILPKVHTGWFVLPLPIAIFVLLLSMIPSIENGSEISGSLPWIPSLGIGFDVYVDGLSLLFGLLIAGIGSLVLLYSIYYLDKSKEKLSYFYVYLMLFMGAMFGLVLSDNLMVLYAFWELTSISSFLLIAFWDRRERSRYGALKSMVVTVCGGLAMFAGFALLYVMSGTFGIRELLETIPQLAEHKLFITAMLLVLAGAFTKSAQFPFHIWLPDAMEAPTPVSAYLHSATMVKAGIYLVARLSPVFSGHAVWLWMVSGVGLLTLIYGSYRAIKQTDLKALLAFSTISQLGLIMSLLGMGSAAAFYPGTSQYLFFAKATTAAIFHLINHAVFKGALFMAVGIVDHETGTRDIRKLGGLMAVMPITFTITLLGAFSMAGIPPFGGFLSKEMFFTALLQIRELSFASMQLWGSLFPIVAWVASVFTFAYSLLLVFRTFSGKAQFEKLEKKPHEAPLGMLIPPLVLASLVVMFGLFPNLLSHTLIEPAMAAIHFTGLQPQEQFMVSIDMWHGWNTELYMTIGVAIVGTAIFILQRRAAWVSKPLTNRVSLSGAYDDGQRLLDNVAGRLTRLYMTGSVRHYLIYIFLFLVLSLGLTMWLEGAFALNTEGMATTSFYEAVVIGALVLSAIAVPFANSRLMAIILTGMAGYMVTLFFVIFRAPDLALTQLIVETVSVALFLLCFYHLPKLKKELVRLPFKVWNLLIAASVGAVMTLIALSASGSRKFESISDYFIENSYKLAGGKNIVNVILVDFRGFDTMLEIVVLGIASYGIYALIRLKVKEDENDRPLGHDGMKYDVYAGIRSNDVILRTVAKLVVVLVLIYSMYLFYMGHHHSGGGFIGGLMASAALLLLAITNGVDKIARIVRVDFKRLTAIGILIALLTGTGSFLANVPFLSHTFGYFDIPLLGELELATATLFDLGVYLTVIGVASTILFTIGRDK
ncbi:Na+/H+ antiporter subunit A [Paenibacillus agaridevorans]|uniref:Na+/H+ antiporter subunit A n=1 Tax=Paenibacillus agaridevorans TaxID=171404 RepID=A0A2R5ENT3_9BACL|nr:Na+/H+ antiporter subunit A [Paenibacillus agaridevorans]GBG08322.1 Na+/H+ antiporter subunit A [Paenibacillus agaridevorans]